MYGRSNAVRDFVNKKKYNNPNKFDCGWVGGWVKGPLGLSHKNVKGIFLVFFVVEILQ